MIFDITGVRGARPCIAGTGITVQRIAILTNEGLRPQEVVTDVFGEDVVTLAQVYGALAFYELNKEELDRDLLAQDAEYERERLSRHAQASA